MSKHRERPQPRNHFLLPLGLSCGHSSCSSNAIRCITGATCRRGSLSSFSQCPAQCEHLHVTSHEPATQLIELVFAVNRDWENTRLQPRLSPGWGGWHYSLEPHPFLSPTLFAHFHQGTKMGMEGEAGEHRGMGLFVFYLVLTIQHLFPSLAAGPKQNDVSIHWPLDQGVEWEKEGGRGVARAKASLNNTNSNTNENIFHTTWQAGPWNPQSWVT